MAGTRAHFRDHLTVSNTEGVLRVASGATVYVYDQYTTDAIGETIYAHDSNHPTLSATTLSNPLTAGNDGEIEFYLADTDRVTLLIQKTGYSDQTIEIDAIKNPAQALVIQEEGSDLTVRGKLNFIGATVTAADDAGNGRTNVTITAPTSGITVSENGTPLDTDISTLDFLGADFDLTESPENEANVALASDVVRDADLAAYQALSDYDAAGDLLYGDGADSSARLAIGTAGQVLKVNSGATAPEWGAATAFVGARAFRSAAQTVPTGTTTAISFTSETYDTDAIHDNSTNPSRMTVPSGKGGYWRVGGFVGWTANATGRRICQINKNGVAVARISEVGGHASAGSAAAGSDVIEAAAGDYFELAVFQDSGGDLDTGNASTTVYMTAHYLGA